jgi:exopolysaccharide biosynthesis protein
MSRASRFGARAWRAGAVAAGIAGLGLSALLPAEPAVAQAAHPAVAQAAAHAAGHGPGQQPGSYPPGSTAWLPSTPANWPQVVDQSRTPTQTITSGVTEYSQTLDTVAGRQHTQILSVNLADPNVSVRAVEAGDEVIDPADETVTSMGTRTGAIAGINGGFFDINASGQPEEGAVVNGQVLKTPPAGYNADLSVLANGTMTIGQENFTGTITDGTASTTLASINTPAATDNGGQAGGTTTNGITEVTPALAASAQPLSTAATIVTGTATGTPGGAQMLTVAGVQTSVKTLAIPVAGSIELAGDGAGATWLSSNVKVGDTITIAAGFSPDANVTQMISGPTVLIKDGQAYTDPTGTPPSGDNPETAVGISKDGKHAMFVTLDGRLGESVAVGVTPAQATGYLLAHGAYNAVLLDGGGSTQIDARIPGTSGLSVLNTPSDGDERPVADGLFVYTNATAPGAATKVVANGGGPVETVPDATIPVNIYATDHEDNPATGTISAKVVPSSLGSWTNGQFTAARAGTGLLYASDGRAKTVEPINVVTMLSSLTVSPAQPDLENGQTQQLTLAGTSTSGASVQIPPQAATWSVADSSLGTVSAGGLFTAADTGGGLTNVTATVGSTSASAAVAVGSSAVVADPMTDTGNWALNLTNGSTATLSDSTSQIAQPGDSGSMDVHYTIPKASGVSQVVFFPSGSNNVTIGDNSAGQAPTAIGVWIKGIGGTPGTPLATGQLTFAEAWIEVDGQEDTFYPTTVTYNGWQLITAQLPAGAELPVSLDFLDFLVINPQSTLTGDLYVADLEGLYSPRVPALPTYTAIPKNPSWLQFKESSSDFSPGGNTILTGDDAHLLADDPGSASANVISAIGTRLPTLAPQARPSVVQAMGDMSDDGLLPDLQFAKSEIAGLGLPYHDAVGNHEITQGGNPENVNFAQVFGDTHYSYTDGGADVIVTDSANGGLLASDPYQVPDDEQYTWLVQQLSDNTSPVVVVATHMPAYDPHPIANSQFADRWEAQMYLQLVQNYQQTHPRTHVVMLYGHARGFAEQILNPEGQVVGPGQGIPQLTVADLGVPAYAPSDEGGFYNFGLLHVTKNGDLQFSVEPVLSSISVTAPSLTLAARSTETVTATGTNVGGDDEPALTLPITDPASHVWSSSATAVATVDLDSGLVTAHRPGTATISVESGGVTALVTITVTE